LRERQMRTARCEVVTENITIHLRLHPERPHRLLGPGPSTITVIAVRRVSRLEISVRKLRSCAYSLSQNARGARFVEWLPGPLK
jgi:hypothetical protein